MKRSTVLFLLGGAVIIGSGVVLLPDDPGIEPAPEFLVQAALETAQRYTKGCADPVMPPAVFVDEWDGMEIGHVDRYRNWSIVLRRSHTEAFPEESAKSLIPHEFTHMLVRREYGEVKDIHGAEFQSMNAFLNGSIKTCPW